MRILDTVRSTDLSLSFEVFPPKTDATFEEVLKATEEIAALKPSFISVTYGAGGKGGKYTLEIARTLQNTPEDMKNSPYPHASDLIREIRKAGDFCIGAACYPEVHPESAVQAEDLRYLKEKVDAGADFLTTQMFFDNNLLYNFLYKLRETGVTVPVVPGIMPITKANQVKRALKLSGSFMPRRFTSLVDKFGSSPEAMQRAGIIYACDQIIDLYANGIRHVHVYTMNKPDVAAAIQNHLSGMLGRTF